MKVFSYLYRKYSQNPSSVQKKISVENISLIGVEVIEKCPPKDCMKVHEVKRVNNLLPISLMYISIFVLFTQ